MANKKIDWTKSKKWHIGCGTMHLNGWLNIDAYDGPAVDCLFNLNNSKSIPSNSAEWIYWSHGPEHIFTDVLPTLLRDLHRSLVPGGKITLATIDFKGIWENRFITHKNGPHWECALYGETRSTDPIEAFHKSAFTTASLSKLLSNAGFSKAQIWRPEQYPEIMKLNDYATSCRLVTTHVEGIK